MDIINNLENWIKENHKSATHLLRTVFWLNEIFPEADEAMNIAAIAHDMERSFPLREGEVGIKNNDTWDSEEYLLWHGQRSAEFLGKFLRENGADEELIDRAEDLAMYHEIGGDEEKNAIMDADSISFLENQADKFIDSIKTEGRTKEKIKSKFDYMLERISSDEAKELAKPFYDQAIEKLNNVGN